jgi:capsular exopolysaccharide synthesis family protein
MNLMSIFSSPLATADHSPGARNAGKPPTGPSPLRPATASASEPLPISTAMPEEQLVSLTKPRSFEAEQYRTLCEIVERRGRSRGLRVLAVSSAGIGDGKTTTALNLAGALAQSHTSRVLIIDGDLRCPAVASQLRMTGPSRPGLADAIRGRMVPLSAGLHRLPDWNLSVLTAGGAEEPPWELLKSAVFDRLILEARTEFDFVVIDCPPLLAVPDCRMIERVVDGFLLVVSADSTPRRLLEEALNVLPPAKVAGIIFNRDVRPLSGYYGYYARTYGDRVI